MLEGVRFQPLRIPPSARHHLNFMAGREVRIRVLRGGIPGEIARLRLGGFILEARISGEAIKSGIDFFARIVRLGENSYELEVRGGRGAGADAEIHLFRSLPLELRIGYMNFLAKMGLPVPPRRSTPRRKEEELKPSSRQTRRPNGEADSEKLSVEDGPPKTSSASAQFFAEFLLELYRKNRPVENWFLREWVEDEGEEELLLGCESSAGEVHGFYLFLSLSRLGKLGVLLSSPGKDFVPIDILLTPESDALERKLLEQRSSLLEGLRFDGVTIATLNITRNIAGLLGESSEYIDYRV